MILVNTTKRKIEEEIAIQIPNILYDKTKNSVSNTIWNEIRDSVCNSIYSNVTNPMVEQIYNIIL